jgi:hypothetical protein
MARPGLHGERRRRGRTGRGSVRKGHSPAELAGIELPTNDWIELLERVAADIDRPASEASLN